MLRPKSATARTSPAMDIPRGRTRQTPRYLYIAAGLVPAAALIIWALSSFSRSQSGVVVDNSTLVTDVAQRGTLLRAVIAQGAFAPERVRVASATQAGVVNQIFVKAGSRLQPGDIIAQMQNPALDAQETDARSALQVAQANLASARQQAQAANITQQVAVEDARAQLQQSRLQAQSLAQLHRKGLVADVQYQTASIQAAKNANDLRAGQAQVGVTAAEAQAKVAAAQAQVDQAAAQLDAASAQVAALTVRAATAGIVQSVDVDPGVSIAQNTEIARIADMRDLKVVLQVAEGDVHSVIPGMPTRIDTGNGIIEGRVARIAPAAQNGTVAVDVVFDRPLPPWARPDANVDGSIEIAKISNAISIARPAGASDNSSIDIFKITDGGARAVRARARLGQGSNDRVQVLAGIAPGDTVIVSDMSNYLDQTQVRLR
jgi:HlyD family secretion protein